MNDAAAAAEAPVLPKTVDGLLAAACAQTGLSDFGDPHFKTGLTHLINALPHEANLNTMGDQLVYGGAIRLLVNRLRMVDAVKRHPEILDERIVKPIIILGLPRTGTSKLQRVMSADPGAQRMDFWRTLNPAPFPDEEPGNPAERIAAAKQMEDTLATLFPGWMARHPMEALEPDEELHIMDGSFECMISWLFSRVPSYYEHISQCDPKPMYDYLHRMMQLLQWQDGGGRERPWIMKSPVHIDALPTLLETFPDAVLVHCHRDLQDIIPSFASLIEEARKIGSDTIDPVEIGRDMCEYWASALDKYLIARDTLPAGRILDFQFDEIQADVIDVIRKIYAAADRPLTPEVQAAFEKQEARRPQYHWGTYSYAADRYGYTPEQIEKRFAEYRKRFPKHS